MTTLVTRSAVLQHVQKKEIRYRREGKKEWKEEEKKKLGGIWHKIWMKQNETTTKNLNKYEVWRSKLEKGKKEEWKLNKDAELEAHKNILNKSAKIN